MRTYDREFQPVPLMLLECKRHNRTHREIDEMELQLELYVQDYFVALGRAEGRSAVFGAVAHGTRIRAWHFTCGPLGTEFYADDLMGSSMGVADREAYRDPYIPAEAAQIQEFFKQVGESAFSPTPQVSYATRSSSSDTSTNIPHSGPSISASTFQHSQEIIGGTENHYYVFEQQYYYYAEGKSTWVQRPMSQWVYNHRGWNDAQAEGRKWRMVDGKIVTYY